MLHGLCILLLSVGLAVLYGLVHDQITIRLCLEYFTIGHPYLVPTQSPTLIALAWGVVATWWMGLLLGFVFWIAMRAGRRPKLPCFDLFRPGLLLLLVMAPSAVLAGIVGYVVASQGGVVLEGSLAERVPPDRHVAFLSALWAHNASYLVGALGGLVLAVLFWRRRGRAARAAAPSPVAALVLAGVCLLTLPGCLEARSRTRLGPDGKVRFEQQTTLDPEARGALIRSLAKLYGAEEAPAILPYADPFSPDWIRPSVRGVDGVRLESLERLVVQGSLVTKLVAVADTLEAAAKADLFHPMGVRLRRHAKEGTWSFALLPPALLGEGGESRRLGGKPLDEVLAAAAPTLQSLDITHTFVFPTPVLATNGSLGSDGRTVSWSLGCGDLAKGRCRLDVTFEDAESLVLQPFLHRSSSEHVMHRALEAPPSVQPPESRPASEADEASEEGEASESDEASEADEAPPESTEDTKDTQGTRDPEAPDRADDE